MWPVTSRWYTKLYFVDRVFTLVNCVICKCVEKWPWGCDGESLFYKQYVTHSESKIAQYLIKHFTFKYRFEEA